MSNDNKLIPFSYEAELKRQILCFDFYGDYAFAGTNYKGTVLRSLDRFSWESFFQAEDFEISAIRFINGFLFVGTSPNGKIYTIDMSTNESTDYGYFGSEVKDFILYNDNILAFCNGDARILIFNATTNNWDNWYSPYANINSVKVINNTLYVVVESGNVLTYNGTNWVKQVFEQNAKVNLLSIRNVIMEPVSNAGEFIDRKSIDNIETLIAADQYSVSPKNRNTGIKSIEQSGSSILYGISNRSSLYLTSETNNIKKIFDTDGNGISNILTLDSNATSIITSDNKIYLAYSPPKESNVSSTTSTATQSSSASPTSAASNKNITITYPIGGEYIQTGVDTTITWESSKSVNDSIQIDLLQNNNEYTIINSNAPNTGEYDWNPPVSILTASNFKVRLTWLSAGNVSSENYDTSANTFTLGSNPPTTTTTTTTQAGQITITEAKGIPILELQDENITVLAKDINNDSILVGTDNGRILSFNQSVINSNMTGYRTVYADVKDGRGYNSRGTTAYLYALYKKLAEISSDKSIKQWTYFTGMAALKNEEITGTFLSPVFVVQNDFGSWQSLVWNQTKPTNTTIKIYLKSANTSEELATKNWIYCTYSSSGEISPITRSLNNVGLSGKYMQMKVVMTTTAINISPIVSDITIYYSSKNSTYFFTTMFSLAENPAKRGLLVANITQPKNTEIQFGINDKDDAIWENYQVVDLEKYFEISSAKDIKVGIRFTSYDGSIPQVDEFALFVGNEQLKALN